MGLSKEGVNYADHIYIYNHQTRCAWSAILPRHSARDVAKNYVYILQRSGIIEATT